ncbi:MAG TPA: ABC transporter ATP-binding protein [Solirubrobacteraceae bacterium]
MFALLFRFRRFLIPYRVRLVGALVALILSVLADLAQPWPLKLVIDSVLGNHPLPSSFPGWLRDASDDTRIATFCVMLLAIAAFGGVVTYLGTYWSQTTGQRMVFDIREAVHAHLHRLSLAYHHSQRPGDLAARLTSDVDRVQDVVIAVLVNFVTSVLTLVGILAIMLYVNWQFTLVALAFSPALFLAVFRYTNRIKWSSRDWRKQEGRVAAVLQESLGGIQLVQAYTREDYEFERFRREAAGSLEASMRSTMLQARFSPIVDFLAAGGTAVVLFVGAHEVLRGSLTLGLLIVFLSYVGALYRPMKQLSKLAYVVSRGTAAAERLEEVMRSDAALPERPPRYRPRRVTGAVRFEDVSFTYPSRSRPALRRVDLVAEPGHVVALVGRTGAGKSTIASLIPRFYDVSGGAVTVDGVDVRLWDLRTLRSEIGLVLQDTWLFQSSVYENIAYGRPDAGREEVEEAARAANVDEFVARLPDGYETLLGPRGATLSGGQRQRIAVARAMLRSAPILILDEPTTGLDRGSEQLVLDALRRLMAERTTILISHHEAPILAADEILVVDDGLIVERTARVAHPELSAARAAT